MFTSIAIVIKIKFIIINLKERNYNMPTLCRKILHIKCIKLNETYMQCESKCSKYLSQLMLY